MRSDKVAVPCMVLGGYVTGSIFTVARPRRHSMKTFQQAPAHARPVRHRHWVLMPLVGALAGCSTGSAPAIVLFGAYFPDWLVFAIVAALFAILTRIAFGVAGRAEEIPFPLFTCLAVGILVAGVIDLVWLDR